MVRKARREPALAGLDSDRPSREDEDQDVGNGDHAARAEARVGRWSGRHAKGERHPPVVTTPREEPPTSGQPGDDIVPRRWREWYPHAREHETAPLVVEQPRRRGWGRMVYLLIVLACLALGGDFLAGKAFWYNAKGTVGATQYPLSPTHVSTVADILVHPGERVHKGQVLLRVNAPQLDRQAALTGANIARIEGQLQDKAQQRAMTIATLQAEISGLQKQREALQQQYDYRQSQIASLRQLYSKGLINYGDLSGPLSQQVQTQVQSAQVKAKLDADRAQLRSLRKQAAAAQHGMSRHQVAGLEQVKESLQAAATERGLQAPVDGVVAQIPVTTGQTIQPGKPAVVIVPDNNQRTLLYFPPAAQARLSAGQKLDVVTPDGQSVTMRVSHIYPSVQDLPEDLRNRASGQTQKIVVAARPVNRQDIAKLPAGTPVTARVSRWSLGDLL